MTNTQIEKILQLINNNKLDDAKQLLKIQLLKNDTTAKNTKLVDVVKKYLDKQDNTRPILKTVMVKNDKQFICNAYSLFLFENYLTELDVLPTSSEHKWDVLDYTKLIRSNIKYNNIDENTLTILKNIKKINTYYKNIDGVDKKSQFAIPFANKYFDAKMILDLCNMLQHDFDGLQISATTDTDAIQLTNGRITALLLPLRVFKDEDKQLYNNRLNDILNNL